jgi:hypothetical protein
MRTKCDVGNLRPPDRPVTQHFENTTKTPRRRDPGASHDAAGTPDADVTLALGTVNTVCKNCRQGSSFCTR